MKAGDGVLLLGLFAWMTVSVGPWWVGAGIFAAGWLLNAVVAIAKRNRRKF